MSDHQPTIEDASPAHDPPPPPVPSSDPRLAIVDCDKPDCDRRDRHDLFALKPSEALQLLSASVEFLVRITGDIPPTPPPATPTNPLMSNIQVEKENIARSHSEKSLARLRAQAEKQDEERKRNSQNGQGGGEASSVGDMNKLRAYSAAQEDAFHPQAIDGVRLKHDPSQQPHPPASAEAPKPRPEPYIIVGADSQPLNLQHGAITRKFYSKNVPPISVNQYLLRLHQFCPMSTAVYLATSLYIHRLAVEERVIPVTRRNAHRLVLAGLRVAMKALEDLSYPHTKIAKVGGVSEVELARLEISFCFLVGFELVVGEELLRRHWETLRDGRVQQMLAEMEVPVPVLRLEKKPHEAQTAP